jgi:hypothetical protein
MRNSVQTHRNGKNVFLNINFSNPITATSAIQASISQTLQQPLVDNPSEYNLIISRFSIPGTAVPLFHFIAQDYLETGNTDPNLGIYAVGLEYNGSSTGPVYLEWVPQTTGSPLIPAFGPLQPGQDLMDPYYFNYSYVNLANMVTTALRAAITAGSGFLPADVDCYMIYNNQSGFFSLLGTTNMAHSASPSDVLNVRIWFNTVLWQFFTGFKNIHNAYNSANGQDEMILIENDRNNSPTTEDGFNPNLPTGYYQMQSEFNNDSAQQSLSRIIMTSDTFGGVVAQGEINTSQLSSYLNMLTDFVPAATTANGSYRSKFQYYAGSEFYRRTLTSRNPLDRISIQFLWQAAQGVGGHFHPLLLEPGQDLTIAFILEKK